MALDATSLKRLLSGPDEDVVGVLKRFNEQSADMKSFAHVDYFTRKALVDLVNSQRLRDPMNAQIGELLLRALRLIARDKAGVDVIFGDVGVCTYITHWAFQMEDIGRSAVVQEAYKCLVNALFHSDELVKNFDEELQAELRDRLVKVDEAFTGEEPLAESYKLVLRIVFIITAQKISAREVWKQSSFYEVIENVFGRHVKEIVQEETSPLLDRTQEILKTLFNLQFRKADGMTEEQGDFLLTNIVTLLNTGAYEYPDIVQQCANMLACLPVKPIFLCPSIDVSELPSNKVLPFNGYNLRLIGVFIKGMEQRIDENELDLLGSFLTILIHYCVASQDIRRFTRLHVLPPLKDSDVSRLPDEGNTLRNKLIRVMGNIHRSSTLASELMFVLCKRSVSRMIKYTGFGHSAGLLANSGLLGQINCPQSQENSEDSETEEYTSVQQKINPVTGSIRPKLPNPFEGMSEEQKEFESMKLVNAMNKLMDAGMIKPGTVGDDGHLRAVSHVLELTKNLTESHDSDSE